MTTLGTFYETIRVEVKKLESLIWMNNLSEAMLFIGGFSIWGLPFSISCFGESSVGKKI